jgi:hypothetical protein
MEDKELKPMNQAEFEKNVRENLQGFKDRQPRGLFNYVPENFRRLGRFGLYSLLKNRPGSFINERLTSAYLPFTMRHPIIATVLIITFFTKVAKTIAPPSY